MFVSKSVFSPNIYMRAWSNKAASFATDDESDNADIVELRFVTASITIAICSAVN